MYISSKEAITSLLFLNAPRTSADLIFVFGNDWLPTMTHVAELYSKGVARKILISGHSAAKDRPQSEALRFMNEGKRLGIPDGAFLLEHEATNTKENILNS